MSDKLLTSNLFQTAQAELPELIKNLFAGSKFPWEILPKIKETVTELVKNTPEKERLSGDISDKAMILSKDVVIEKGAKVEGLAYIDGPTYISSGATIRHGAYIRGGVFIGKDCVAGHTTEIKDSLLLNGSKAAHFAYLGNSILGQNVNLGAGTKLANLRLDHRNILIRYEGETIDTGLKKFGAIFSDGAQSGCNSVTNPGTLLLNSSALLPTKCGSGVIDNKLGLVKR